MQAIQTKYLGPTDSRGARIKAFAQAGSMTFDWDYELNPDQNAHKAAKAFCKKFNWEWHLIGGCLKDGSYVFVAGPRPCTCLIDVE